MIKSFLELYTQEPTREERYVLISFEGKSVEVVNVRAEWEKNQLVAIAEAYHCAPEETIIIRDSFLTSRHAVIFRKSGKSKVNTPLPPPYAGV